MSMGAKLMLNHEIPDGTVYKLVLKEPVYTKGLLQDGSKAHCGGFCPCFGEVVEHKEPRLFLINQDPQQMKPFTTRDGKYK